jgi:LysR family nitrogen assimilation transcriptional regulator
LNLVQLKYFVTTADSGSLSRAGAELAISQPALSRSIRQLEEHFGVHLFARTGRGVELTDSGQRLYEHATTILSQVEQANYNLGAERRDNRRSVMLGLPASVARTHLVPIVADFLKASPGTALRVVEAYSRQLVEAINEGALDVAIMYANAGEHDFRNEFLFEERVYLVCRPDASCAQQESVPFRALKDLPLILPRPRNTARAQVDSIAAELGIVLRPIVELDSLAATKDLVIAGLGCAIYRRSIVADEVERGLLSTIPIENPVMVRKLELVTSRKFRIAPEAEALLEIIRRRVMAPAP